MDGPEELDDAFREALQELDDWLEGIEEERLGELVLPLASRLALPEAGFDLARYQEEARVFVEATPLADQVLDGYVDRVAYWLSRRLLLDEENRPLPPEATAALLEAARAAVARRAEQVDEAGYPRVAAGLRRVLEESAGGEPPADLLWSAMALRIAETAVA